MKNKLWIILMILVIVGAIGVAFFLFTKNSTSDNVDYSAQKTAVNEHQQQNNEDNYSTINNGNNNSIEVTQSASQDKPKKEELLSSFSTKIYTKDSSRQNNLSITSSLLNETIISNGSIFSFCNTIGPATSAKGYQEADIFDKDGNKKKGLGGGNCQISTTLYNAVLKVPSLVVTERHEHSNKVPYIANGKDAAVAYGSYDLKLRNDTGYDVKIKSEVTEDKVTISLYKLI